MPHQPQTHESEIQRMARELIARNRAHMVIAAAKASAELQARVRLENHAYDLSFQGRAK